MKPAARRSRRAVSVPVDGTALLLIDVINDLDFPGSDALVSQAEGIAAPLGQMKRRADAAGMPIIYVNDNFGQWRSDFRQTVAHLRGARRPAASSRAGSSRRRRITSF